MFDTNTPIRTRRDGSIDTAHYIARGRQARSEQAHNMARNAGAGIARTVTVSALFLCGLAILPFLA